MNIIFEVNGGVGKNIIATVILELLRKKYPNDKIIVISDAKDIFFNNPHLDILTDFEGRVDILDKYVHNNLDNCLILVKPNLFLELK